MVPEDLLSTSEDRSNHDLQRIIHSWHPKLSLYRLLVLLATIGLGVAKAVTAYLNFNYASITLEWITGVVVFILYEVVSLLVNL